MGIGMHIGLQLGQDVDGVPMHRASKGVVLPRGDGRAFRLVRVGEHTARPRLLLLGHIKRHCDRP